MARTQAALKALNSVSASALPRSTISIPNRRSGLSVPNRSRASFHDIVTMSGGRSPVAAKVASITASLTNAEHLVLADEGRLDVELGELELAVRAQILVAHAPGELVITVDPADHEQLLGDLWALGQHVERAALQAGRDRELTRALGGRRPEQRRLDLDEALALHGPAQSAVHLGAQPQVALHPLGSEVQVAIAKTDRLVGIGAPVQRERRSLRCGEDLHDALPELHFAGGQRRVHCAFGTEPHSPRNSQHVLRPQVVRPVDDALDDPGVVAQVYEREVLAVFAPAPSQPQMLTTLPASPARSAPQ